MNKQQLIQQNNIPLILEKIDKVLFIIHLAIGDFSYLQSAFRALKKHYPHLKIDLFVVESRCTDDATKWPLLKGDVIYDWLENCGLFNKVYRKNYAPVLFKEAILEAKKEQYPLIISFGDVHSEPTERYAREMAAENTVVAGLKLHINWYRLKYQLSKRELWKKLDITFNSIPMKKGRHISDLFNHWFKQIGGFDIPKKDRLPYIEIPKEWEEKTSYKLKKFQQFPDQPIVFINYLAKDPNRTWKLEQALSLIEKMQTLNEWHRALFILNATPDQLETVSLAIDEKNISNTIPFSAVENFYELPAILKLSSLIISVETSIMHLANAVNTPLIALMRHKTPEWEPLKKDITTVIWCDKKKDKMVDIKVETVFEAVKALK